eukprot:2449904-Amphidinium_carterae.1
MGAVTMLVPEYRCSSQLHIDGVVGHCCVYQGHRSVQTVPTPARYTNAGSSEITAGTRGAGNRPCNLTQAGISTSSAGSSTWRRTFKENVIKQRYVVHSPSDAAMTALPFSRAVGWEAHAKEADPDHTKGLTWSDLHNCVQGCGGREAVSHHTITALPFSRAVGWEAHAKEADPEHTKGLTCGDNLQKQLGIDSAPIRCASAATEKEAPTPRWHTLLVEECGLALL